MSFDESVFLELLHGVPQTAEQLFEEEIAEAERPLTVAEQEAKLKESRRKAREIEEEWKRKQEQNQGFAIVPRVELGPPSLIPKVVRKIPPIATRLATDVRMQEEVFKEVEEIWYAVFVEGPLQSSRAELERRQNSKHAHKCTVTPGCNVQKIPIWVFWPTTQEAEMTGARKHICIPAICQFRHDTMLHHPEYIAWKYDRFFACQFSGNIHHCRGTGGFGCNGPLEKNDEGFWICMISQFQYSGSFDNDIRKRKQQKSIFDSNEVETPYSSIYAVERESRQAEYRMIQQMRQEVGLPLGTSFPICKNGQLIPLPDRAAAFRNVDEQALAELRHKMWTMFFGKSRAQSEMQKIVSVILQIMHDIHSEYCGKKLPCIFDLETIVRENYKQMPAYVDVIGNWDLVDKLRFVNYYAFYAFCVWQHVIYNWHNVVLVQRQVDSELDIYPDASNSGKDVVQQTDQEMMVDAKGGMILDNCAPAVLRFMVDNVPNSHDKFGGHRVLKLLMPPLNVLEQYGFTVHSATSTRNLLDAYFSRIQNQTEQMLPCMVSMPMITFDEVRMLPREEPFDQGRDGDMVREVMTKSLVIPLPCSR